MKKLEKQRFLALAGYARNHRALLRANEIEYWVNDNESLIAVVIMDKSDKDYSAIILGRSKLKKFRCIAITDFTDSLEKARSVAFEKIKEHQNDSSLIYDQEDENGDPVDFFSPLSNKEKINKSFEALSTNYGYKPARELIENMMYYFDDPDKNFIEQFQTTGFDSRIWELYLFAALSEMGLIIDRSKPAPDFKCTFLDFDFFVEATTVNPTDGPQNKTTPPEGPNETMEYVSTYMAIKFGSALYSKLKKKYWELPHVKGKPLVFAIQDFHMPGSMTWTTSTLAPYLYGFSCTWQKDANGSLVIEYSDNDYITFKEKKIPSGFFLQKNSENISAILTNPSGTITKFNRIGYISGFGPEDIMMAIIGQSYKHDDNSPVPNNFLTCIKRGEYQESWREGMNIYHNPHAKHPIPEEIFPDAAHHFFLDGRFFSHIPKFHPFSSHTIIVTPRP